jgi:hypothetical protein
LKAGFSSKRYQLSREEDVNMEPIAPANWQIITETRSLKIFTLNI